MARKHFEKLSDVHSVNLDDSKCMWKPIDSLGSDVAAKVRNGRYLRYGRYGPYGDKRYLGIISSCQLDINMLLSFSVAAAQSFNVFEMQSWLQRSSCLEHRNTLSEQQARAKTTASSDSLVAAPLLCAEPTKMP